MIETKRLKLLKRSCNMQVSVIIPNYNHAPFLERRIQSVFDQTFQNFEIILLDDCSTDESRTIIEKYRAHPKVSNIIYNETNGGSPFAQWLKGIQAAKRELIWIAESDDWCEKNFLEVLVEGFEKNENCVAAFCQSYCVGDSGEVRWQSHHSTDEYVNGKAFFEERLAYGCTIFNVSMAMFKREAALSIPGDFISFKSCGDWFFWINLVRNGDVFINSKVLNYYRRSKNSLTEKAYSTGHNFIEELKMFELIKAQRKESIPVINDSIFNRYNSFQKRKNRLSAGDARLALRSFYHSFGGYFHFKIFLLHKRINHFFSKLRRRTKVVFDNSNSLKATT